VATLHAASKEIIPPSPLAAFSSRITSLDAVLTDSLQYFRWSRLADRFCRMCPGFVHVDVSRIGWFGLVPKRKVSKGKDSKQRICIRRRTRQTIVFEGFLN
jgi:hypothetical protein